MIKESVKAYGKKQFEVKQKVSFSPAQKKINYYIETYFFLPPDLQINSNTYPPEQFQRSMKNYVRLRQPVNPDFLTDPTVLITLKEKLQQLESQLDNVTVDGYESHMKLFALMYKRALRFSIKNMLAQDPSLQPQVMHDLLMSVHRF